ncbi:MAG: hypothetical protein QOG54_107 [Actinomycetota bacterium]|nr:hypothetical protein [Actinomycetota bacterium]
MAFGIGENRQGLATTSLVLGAGLIALGCLLSRLEGEFELGPVGLKGILKRFAQEARDRDLTDEQLEQASDLIKEQIAPPSTSGRVIEGRAVLRGSSAIRATGNVDGPAVVEKAVAQVIRLSGVPSQAEVGRPTISQTPPSDPTSAD